ncbi:hypothetical protein F4604DRAFT_1935078 [Suillus subluteus]|nr:hypothetical protein F4604DRAFT_1935078 [Suillus subluteus]
MQGEALHEDKPTISCPNPINELIDNAPTISVPISTESIQIVDLYTVGYVKATRQQVDAKEAVPFLHQVSLEGPKGEIIRVRALFDDGAMVGVMCTSVFNKVKHRLHNWTQSKRKLHMANGNIVSSLAKWEGTIEIEGVQARGEFEVFDSGGGWGFLFGKTMLQAFKAVHEYEMDTMVIADQHKGTTLGNQIENTPNKEESLTLDSKQWGNTVGGLETPPLRQVLTTPSDKGTHETNNKEEHMQILRTPYGPMGQWRLTEHQQWRQDKKQVKQLWWRAESGRQMQDQMKHTTGERETKGQSDISVITINEALNPKEQILGELPELPPVDHDPSIYTRQTNPFKLERVAEIVRQVMIGNDFMEAERWELEQFIKDNADLFALSLWEVNIIPGAQLNLNVPEGKTFNLHTHQRLLTPEQSHFYNERVEEMLKAEPLQ